MVVVTDYQEHKVDQVEVVEEMAVLVELVPLDKEILDINLEVEVVEQECKLFLLALEVMVYNQV